MAGKTRKERIVSLKRELEKERKVIAASRDRLRELMDDYTNLLVSCEAADEYLDAAIESLSEFA